MQNRLDHHVSNHPSRSQRRRAEPSSQQEPGPHLTHGSVHILRDIRGNQVDSECARLIPGQRRIVLEPIAAAILSRSAKQVRQATALIV